VWLGGSPNQDGRTGWAWKDKMKQAGLPVPRAEKLPWLAVCTSYLCVNNLLCEKLVCEDLEATLELRERGREQGRGRETERER
jgi:hypothetical protein